jgi:hypothetical protein
MPRNYQAPQAPNAQAYGQRGDQMSAQQAMPLPKVPNDVPNPERGPQGPDMGSLIQMAQQFDPQITPLSAPSMRPGEPLTQGLPMGPGAGPEVLAPTTTQRERVAQLLHSMALSTGDPSLTDLSLQIRGRL